MKISEYLKEKKLIIDGAMGTYYSSIKKDENAIVELANIDDRDLIMSIHKEYIDAGAGLIRTNSFASSRQMLNVAKDEQVKIIKESYNIAKDAVRSSKKEIYIAADIGPIPENSISKDEDILDEYKLICDTFMDEGADVFLFETFSSLTHIDSIVKYIKEKKDVFIITNFCVNKNGYTKTGMSAARILEEVSQIDEIDGVGFNCGIGSGHMYQLLKNLVLPNNKFIVTLPNSGYPEQLQNRMVFLDNIYYFTQKMEQISKLGVSMIGGCCGTTPAYIKKMATTADLSITKKQDIQRSIPSEKKIIIQKNNEFYDLFNTGKKVVAVELDPPFDASYDKLVEYAHKLKNNGTDIITFADSPMGRSRVDSILMSIKINKEVGIPVMPHICCRDKNMIAMRSGLLGAYINDIRNILVVTGDPVPSLSREETTGVFDYNSIQLMNFIKDMNEEHFTKEPVYYGGAINYARGNINKIIERIEKKIEAGAKYFLTQPIYSTDDIERIRTIKNQTNTKILCGIMPLVSYRNANFIRNEIKGISIPDEIVNKYDPNMTKEEAEIVGANIANEIIEKLSSFADGYYFMLPFNRVSLMDKIYIK